MDYLLRQPSTQPLTSALDHLRIAFSYLEDAESAFDGKKKLSHEDIIALFPKVENAAKHIADARSLDPNQQLTIQDDKLGELKFTQDFLAGIALYREGRIATLAAQTADLPARQGTLQHQARRSFEKAIHFAPSNATYHLELAKISQVIGNKQRATEAVQAVLKFDPHSVEAHKLLDQINEMPPEQVNQPTAKPKKKRSSFSPPASVYVFGGGLLFSILALFAGEYSTAIGVFIITGIAAGIYGKFTQGPNSYHSYDRARTKKEMADLRSKIYGDRYNRENK